MRWAVAAGLASLNLGHDLTLIVDEFSTKFEEIDYLNEDGTLKNLFQLHGRARIKSPWLTGASQQPVS